MDERTIALLAAALVLGFILGRLSKRSEESRIVWTEPIDPATADDEVRSLVLTGKKIQAIKRHRELTKAGLKEAKDYVDALEEHLRAHPPPKR